MHNSPSSLSADLYIYHHRSASFFHNDGSIIGVIVVIIGVPPRRHPAFGLPLPSRDWGSCVFVMWDPSDEG